MMERGLASIVVPVYNVKSYLRGCVKSITNQSYDRIQIILVDDGSTDGSGEICDELAKTDSRIEVIHKANGGLGDARNVGMQKASGEYLAFVDSDDKVKRDFIEVLVKAIEKEGADIAAGGIEVTSGGKKRSLATFESRSFFGNEQLEHYFLHPSGALNVVAWNKIYKRKMVAENDLWFPVGKKHEDAFFAYKVFETSKKAVYVNRAVYSYEQRAGSILHSALKEQDVDDRLELFEEIDEWQEKKVESLKKAVAIYVSSGLVLIGKDLVRHKLKYVAGWDEASRRARRQLPVIRGLRRTKDSSLSLYLGVKYLARGKRWFYFYYKLVELIKVTLRKEEEI